MSSASVREMVRRGDARPDGRVGSEAMVGEDARPAFRLEPLREGCPVLVWPEGSAPVRGVARAYWTFLGKVLLETPTGLVQIVCPLKRIYRLDRVRRDGIY